MKSYTLDFEAQIQRSDPTAWEVVAIMRLGVARADYAQGAIDGMLELLSAWQRHDPTILTTRIYPRLDTGLVE